MSQAGFDLESNTSGEWGYTNGLDDDDLRIRNLKEIQNRLKEKRMTAEQMTYLIDEVIRLIKITAI